MSDLTGFEPPRIDWTAGPDLPQRLKRFRQKCELLFDGPLKDRTVKQQCRYVLLWVGDYGLDLYNTWNLSETDQDKLDEYWKRFEQHVKPQSNHLLNRFYLRNLKQNGRPLDEFLTEANLLIQNSGYPNELHDELLRDALVFGVDSDTVRKKCIAEGNELTFGKAREIARTEEATGRQLEMMTRDVPNPMQVDSLQKNRKRNIIQGRIKPLHDRQKGQNVRKEKTVCNRCGKAAHNKDKKCPAIKAQCFGCKKIGHYQKVCFKTTKTNCNSLEHESGNSNEVDIDDKIFLGTLVAEQCLNFGAKPNLNSLSTEQRKKVLIETHLTAEPYHKYTTPVVCKIDTGAELNVLSKHDYEKVVPNPKRRKLESPNIKITAYGGHEIRNIGTCQLYIHHKGEAQPIVFNVTDVEGPAILGCKTSCDLGLVQFPSKVFHVHASAPNSSSSQNAGKRVTPLTKESLLKEYPDRFEGLGTFKAMKPYHITLEPNAEPVIHPPRQVPVHLKDHYKQEIDNLLELGVITPVERPTDWVNSVVLSETTSDKGEIVKVRLCLDPRDLNKWVKREHYRTRTIDEVVVELKDAKFFTVVDAKKGYWHVPLDEESSYLTTFSTPYGRYRFLRLPFGLVVSQDIFQKQLDTALEGLNGITGIADDTFVYGSSEEEHDANLVKLMERARDKGVIFNKEKLQFKCKEVSFFGHTWTLQGMKPDDKKVSAILGMKPPEDAKSLKSFLGLVSYLTRYSGRLATLSSPLRDLIKQDVAYSWGPEHARAFDEVKKEVSSLGVLRYFDPSAETTVQTDASLKGLGAVLLQGGQPICYASKALTEIEQRYSNIEREALGVVWGLERFHYFIYGKKCTVHTDHKPLETIFRKKLSSCPSRLQRFVLRALKYDVTVTYVKGEQVPIADALSRISPQPVPPKSQLPQLDIHQITSTLPASPIKLQQIRDETASDPVLSKLREVVYRGWPATREQCPQLLHDYWNFREELTIEDGLILKQERIIMPASLRGEILSTIHEGHLGQEKCLLRARAVVFWPGITKDVIHIVESCDVCQKHQRRLQKQNILQPEPPCYPWQVLNSDLFEYRGNSYLLLSDEYSKFPIVRKLNSTTSYAIINHLKSIFAEYGIPEKLVTDNGPQYASREFQQFATVYGFQHSASSPMYPQSNGSSERMVQTMKGILKKCDEDGTDPYLGLLAYRSSPVSHRLKSPSELLNSRKLKTTLPIAKRACVNDNTSIMKNELQRRQEQQALYYNRTAGPTLKSFSEGEPVHIYDHHSKTWEPGTVVKAAKEPRSYIVKNNRTESVYRRTRTQLRPSSIQKQQTNPQSMKLSRPITPFRPSCNQKQETKPPMTLPPDKSSLPGNQLCRSQPYCVTRSGRISKPPERLNLQ